MFNLSTIFKNLIDYIVEFNIMKFIMTVISRMVVHWQNNTYQITFIIVISSVIACIWGMYTMFAKFNNSYNVLMGNVQKQGAWGETILYNTLNSVGLEPGRDYLQQPQYNNGEYRPDCVLKISKYNLIIDSKVCIQSLHNMNSKQHAKYIKQQVNILASKKYTQNIENSFDICVMFLPTDNMLSSAVKVDHRLISYALSKDIAVTSPSTLLTTLKLIEQLQCNQEIQDRYDKARKGYKLILKEAKILIESTAQLKQHANDIIKQHDYINKLYDQMKHHE